MKVEDEVRENNPWDDEVLRGVKYTYSLLSHMASERSQLYGTLAVIMENNNLEEVTISLKDFKHVGEDLYVYFEPVEGTDGVKVKLVKQGEDAGGNKS